MNQHVIESLVMDQALNALSSDTEELLKAYLSEHTEFQDMAGIIHSSRSETEGQLVLWGQLSKPGVGGDQIIH